MDGERLLRSAEGSSVVLECKTKGNPNPEIIWRKEQSLISPQPVYNSRLILENLIASDSSK